MFKIIKNILFLFVISFVFILFNLNNSYKTFSEIAILNDGRIKPLESFAKANLSGFLKKEKYYSYYIADITFNFDEFCKKKVLIIKNNDLLLNISLKRNIKNLYSITDIMNGFLLNSDNLNILLKSDVSLLNSEQKNLIDLYFKINFLIEIKDIFNNTRKNINNFFYTIKVDDNKWINLNNNIENYSLNNFYTIFNNMKINYSDNKSWEKYCLDYKNEILKKLILKEKFILNVEIFYNQFNFLFVSIIFYFLFFIFSFLLTIINSKKINSNIFLYTAFLLSLIDIVLKFLITFRPPVTNLHESIIFVNIICSLVFINLIKKNNIRNYGIVFISIILFFIQLIGYKYNFNIEIKNLSAVLNTNFWLTIHVLIITSGYACCLITSIFSHIYIISYIFKNKNIILLNFNYINLFSMLSFLFCFSGTILGGVWADQSWGRFWGWDPKENGALLIVLWIILFMHIKYIVKSKLLYVYGFSLLTLALATSWFGVNLLNIGFHSYGFIKNMELLLLIIFIIETFFVIITLYIFLIRKQ